MLRVWKVRPGLRKKNHNLCCVCRSFGRRERLLKHLETHGIHELAHEPRGKKPKEEQEQTNPAYANLRKTYPKKEPIKQEPDFNMPGIKVKFLK